MGYRLQTYQRRSDRPSTVGRSSKRVPRFGSLYRSSEPKEFDLVAPLCVVVELLLAPVEFVEGPVLATRLAD